MPCPGIIFAGHVLPPDCWRYGRIRNRVLKRKNSALQSGRIASYSAGMNRIFTFWSCQSAPLSIQSRIFCRELWRKCGAAEAVLEKALRKKNFFEEGRRTCRDGEMPDGGLTKSALLFCIERRGRRLPEAGVPEPDAERTSFAHKKSLTTVFFAVIRLLSTFWWRRGESNSRPRKVRARPLQV